jgi:hypothetical protein
MTDARVPIQPAMPSKHNCFPQFTGSDHHSYFDCGRQSTLKVALRVLFAAILSHTGPNQPARRLTEATQPSRISCGET